MIDSETTVLNSENVIIQYLTEQYQPDAIIVYGSYAEGSFCDDSDFDALVITNHIQNHDSSVINHTILDVFIYPLELFQSKYDPEEFIQIFDGKIILDKSGIAESLQKQVLNYIEQKPKKTNDEMHQELAWCNKMLTRTTRMDAEGFYRWHWLLVDSLEIYYDIKKIYYYGPKKALYMMEKTDPEAFRIYSQALQNLDRKCIEKWISYLTSLLPGK